MAFRKYSAEYKLRAVEATQKGETVRDVCKRLGLQPPRLYEWMRQFNELEEQVDKEMLKKHGRREDLTIEQARALDASDRDRGETADEVTIGPLLKAEMELLQEEYALLRNKYLRLKAGAA